MHSFIRGGSPMDFITARQLKREYPHHVTIHSYVPGVHPRPHELTEIIGSNGHAAWTGLKGSRVFGFLTREDKAKFEKHLKERVENHDTHA